MPSKYLNDARTGELIQKIYTADRAIATECKSYTDTNYLPLSGGTMTGTIVSNVSVNTPAISMSTDDNVCFVFGGSGRNKGARIGLNGKDMSNGSGYFTISADDGTNTKQLQGKPDGTLTWGGNDIALSKDFLPLRGGTMSGRLTFPNNQTIELGTDHTDGTGGFIGRTETGIRLAAEAFGYTAAGGYIDLDGQSIGATANAGRFTITARANETTSKALIGYPDGTLTWGGNVVQTAKQYKTTITPASGFANYNTSYPITAYRVGNVVQIYGILKTTSQQTDDEHTLFTLPNGYRPIDALYQLAQGSSMNRWLLKISMNGVATIARYGTTASTTIAIGAWLPFSATFITTNAYPS